jgi:hypothetical protein
VKRAQGFEVREVKLGVNDHVRTAVLEGLRQGEEVALDPLPAPALVASK